MSTVKGVEAGRLKPRQRAHVRRSPIPSWVPINVSRRAPHRANRPSQPKTPRAKARGVAEAPTGVEPVMEVLQTSALPLGYGAEMSRKDNVSKSFAQLRHRPARRWSQVVRGRMWGLYSYARRR